MHISRRSILAGAGALLAGSASAEELAPIYQAARKEGQLTWYSGFLDQEICVRIGNAFTQKYPGVTVSASKTTSQVAFQRLLQDMKAGQIQCDVFSSTDPSHMAYLQQKGLLIAFDPPNASGLVPSLRTLSPDNTYFVGWVGVGALGYNTAKVTEAEAPKDWPDLATPRWKDQATFGSPIYSGVVGSWAVAMEKLYGWSYFDKLNALNPLIGRSFDDAVTVLNSGERLVGMVNVSGVARTAAKGNPIAVRYPTAGTLVVPSATAAMKGCHNPNAAKLFLDFTCGPEYSRILADEFEVPLRTDVQPAAGTKSLADVKTLTPTLAEITAMLPEAKDKWKATFS